MPAIQAVIFDLDDTLYPERDYAHSGFEAVARHFAGLLGDPADRAARMRRLLDSRHRGRVFNALLAEIGLAEDAELIRRMIDVYRGHVPRIALFPDADEILSELRHTHHLGLLSDGPAHQQRLKVEALNLPDRLDAIMLTGELGPGRGKPHPLGFERLAATLIPQDAGTDRSTGDKSSEDRSSGDSSSGDRSTGERSTEERSTDRNTGFGCYFAYVADNPAKDFVAPNALGWRTIQIRRTSGIYADVPPAPGGVPHHVIHTLRDLPQLLT